MPRYAALIYSPAETEGQGTPEDWARVMEEYDAFGAEAGAAGVILGGEALQDTTTATTIHVEGGKGGDLVTMDGPFAETKEVLGGFYLLQADDLDEAIAWASRIPGAWHGRVEVRPLVEFDEG
jgi:hypothetical protein